MSNFGRGEPSTSATLDPSRAHSGRIHDVLLGAGKDAYLVDLAVGRKVVAEAAAFRSAARTARMFLLRAVHHLAATGVRQFVELGSGYPCAPNLHEVARDTTPDAHTLYVDHDPVVAAHGRVFLTDDHTDFVHADLTDTATIATEIRAAMDPGAPIAVCLSFVAEFITDPRAVVEAVTAALPSGSFVVFSHVTSDIDTAMVDHAADIYRAHDIALRPRTREEIATILSGCDLLEPGLVAPHQWRPSEDLDRRHAQRLGWEPPRGTRMCYAAVGRIR
ncbi:SAM-dependent methyltransferase [Nocardia sp. CNY236]|uniref:SAM-dependent methyltransferase n=1 Tax=Nocardia sp. CNY236 TaxID=1169152 RepID=UPI0004285148|nr:SAM-dependent methyltransferase [Nocardia sp. CNY236]